MRIIVMEGGSIASIYYDWIQVRRKLINENVVLRYLYRTKPERKRMKDLLKYKEQMEKHQCLPNYTNGVLNETERNGRIVFFEATVIDSFSELKKNTVWQGKYPEY